MATRKKTWTITGIFLGTGIFAWAGAMVVGRMATSWLALPDGAQLAKVDAGDATPGPSEDADAAAAPPSHGAVFGHSKSALVNTIVKRNIFDSTQVTTATESADVGDSDRKSDLKAVLLATVVADPPEYSSALISEEGRKDAALGYGVGDQLMGEATIVRIEQRRIIIRRTDGTIEYISMEGEDQQDHKDTKSASGDDDGIYKNGDNKYTVDKDTVDNLIANPEQLYSQIRVTPHRAPGGDIDGYRVSGIRRNSFFAKLGLKNGDVVHAVNGKSLTSVSEAMDAYNSLQSERSLTFDITRRNQNQTFDYEIR